MTVGIGELQRVVFDVGIAVQGLGGIAGRDDGVGLGKAAQFGVPATSLGTGSVAALVEVQAGFLVDGLAGIAIGHIERGGIVLIALVAEGGPSTALGTGSAGVLDDVAGAVEIL